MNVSTVATEQSELREMVLCETDKRGIPVNREELTPERRRPENISPGALQQVKMGNNQWNCVDHCFGVCGKADSVNRPQTCSCWSCCCLMIWGYHVSCLAAIVIEGQFFGIYLFTVDPPVRDADWSVEYSVGLIPVGDIRIDYLRDPVDRAQSTDAAPLTELLLFHTLRRLRNYCAAGYILCWTFCDTVWKPLRVEGLFLRRGSNRRCGARGQPFRCYV